MSKVKFPDLYKLIKSNDIETLEKYWQVYPETSVFKLLTVGKRLSLISQACISSNIETITWLIDKTKPEEMLDVGKIILMKYKAKNSTDTYEFFTNKLYTMCEANPEHFHILYKFVMCVLTSSIALPDSIYTNILSNRLLNLQHNLTNQNFRDDFEFALVHVTARVMGFVVDFYKSNQINLSGLYGNVLLYGSSFQSVYKLFNDVDISNYFQINHKYSYCVGEPYEVKLSTLIVMSEVTYKLNKLLENKELGDELIMCVRNISSDCLYSRKFPIFNTIARAYNLYTRGISLSSHNATSHHLILFGSDSLAYFELLKPVLSKNFFPFLVQIGLLDANFNPIFIPKPN